MTIGLDLELVSVLKQDAITGFSYSFTKALLDKLCELHKTARLFKAGMEDQTQISALTPLAYSVVMHLGDQINSDSCSRLMSWVQVIDLMDTVEEFLDIFHKKKSADSRAPDLLTSTSPRGVGPHKP